MCFSQKICLPIQILANLSGPVEGRKHDSSMLDISNLYQLLTQYSIKNGDLLCIYGDPIYPIRLQLQAPYMNALLTPQQKDFNMSMSKVQLNGLMT